MRRRQNLTRLLKKFIYSLDVEDDKLWTKKGEVKMSVVEAKFGKDVDRIHVDIAVGHDFTRETLRGLLDA